MGYWLAPSGAAKTFGHVKRFDPRYWSVNFPRPMMAAVTTIGPNALRVNARFYRADDLGGLIWEAEDRFDHPLLRYETARDFRQCRLSFRWQSDGVKPLDALHGPTLTIEGRDEGGGPRSWFVRLWNYAQGTAEDALIELDFAALDGGFVLPGEADPVWAGDVDRMFISFVAPGYDQSAAALDAPADGWIEISDIVCDGGGSTLSIGDAMVPEHRLRIATGYDDLYHLTPARVLRNVIQLGYRSLINHYVGMSHYFELDSDGLATGALNPPCSAWHGDLLARAKTLGFGVILSLSYELLDQHCPEGWKQRAEDGMPALTGWEPPSSLLSPANAEAMSYLRGIGAAFAALAVVAGQPVRFQIGEPWWWVMGDGRICLYDAAAVAAFAPVPIGDVRGSLDSTQQATLDAAGAVLAASTSALAAAVKDVDPDAEIPLLAYLPTVLDGVEVQRANLPLGWATPAFDVLQLEDYAWVTRGNAGATARGIAAASARLGYAVPDQHYFAGFVLNPEDADLWRDVAHAAEAAFARGTAEVFVWALPQVLRDGFVWFDEGEEQVQAFDDVLFPIALGREASVEPAFATAIVTTASGAEQRNSDWANARLRFDAGPGVRSEAELQELIAFFRARRGAARAFRFKDPFDHSSHGMIGTPTPADQPLGMGDGVKTDFPLVKVYEEQERRITRPAAGSVRISAEGVERLTGWILADGGIVRFDEAPADGVELRAGFQFDVPVRFAEDRLTIRRATFEAGEAPTVPLVEVRE